MYFCFSCLIIFCRCLLRIFQSWLSISKFLKRGKDVWIAKGSNCCFLISLWFLCWLFPFKWQLLSVRHLRDPIHCWWVRTRLCCMNASASKHHSEPHTRLVASMIPHRHLLQAGNSDTSDAPWTARPPRTPSTVWVVTMVLEPINARQVTSFFMLSFILKPINARQVTSFLCLVLSLDNVYKSSKACIRHYSFFCYCFTPTDSEAH
jgi:hypothetical protein